MESSRQVHIGGVIRNAIAFDIKNWRAGTLMPPETLFETIARLFSLLEERKTEYVLVGGIALLNYVEGRNTEDIDLIIAASSLQNLPEITVVGENQDFVRGTFQDLKVGFRLTRNALFEKVRSHYATVAKFTEREIPCATVEGLLLLKLYALPSLYRQGNFARVSLYENDVAALMQAYQPDMGTLFGELSPHLSTSDLQAVREIVKEIEERLKRFRRGLDSA